MLRNIALLLAAALVVVSTGTVSALDVGDKAPNFTAKGIDGKEYSLEGNKDADLVIVCFTCNQCPVAVAYEDRFIDFNKKYKDKNVTFIALNCNNASEGLEAMKQRAEEKGFNFVYAFDETGEAAKEYGAKVTPELFIVKDGKVAYHGSYDDSQNDPEKSYLVNAVDALLAGSTPEVTKTRAFGCGIKVK
jgi:peroxiredoxin